ncbi:hypothetical protein AB0H29_22395 [Streptomyces thermolilacinus]
MRTHLRRPAAVSLALAAALALAGCSSGDSGRSGDSGSARTEGAAAPATATPSLSAADRVAGEQDAAPSAGPGSAPGSAPGAAPAPGGTPAGPVRPDAALTPATGSFTPKEKRYLSGRVPRAVDPAAVLDVGKETCQRITRTAKHDKDAAAAAVVAGDLRDADDAVTHLCPDQRPVLDAAEGGYPDGTHASPAPGRYRTVSAGPGCSWQVTDAKGTRVAGGPAPGATGPHTLTLAPGAARFESSGCYAWLRA